MRIFLVAVCLGWLAQTSHSLDRQSIRQAILTRRVLRKANLGLDELEAINFQKLRTKRQTSLAVTDDEDLSLDGSGDQTFKHSDNVLPPHERSSFWVWYRTEINFLDSIKYTDELKDHYSDAFLDLSDEIMADMENYLKPRVIGYMEATPVMFIQKDGWVQVFVDVGVCNVNSAKSVNDLVRGLLRGGKLGRFYISEEHVTIKQIGVDHERLECGPEYLPQATAAPTTVPQADVTIGFTTTTELTEPLPPDANVIVTIPIQRPTTRPGICQRDQATCANGQCIDRIYVCDGSQDCWDGSDEASCANSGNQCDPTQFMCEGTGVCVQKHWRCDGDNDCGNGFDEQDCSTERNGVCLSTQFQCADRSCIPSSYHCDGERDCASGNDEEGCSAPVVIVAPPRSVNATEGSTVTIECEALGTPAPVISWRVNWGNVPPAPRVTMSSSNGRGQIVIRKVKPSDQGAYTCEAINRIKAVLGVPDAILVVGEEVEDEEPYECPPGEFNSAKPDEIKKCKPCYCFGVTDLCTASKLEFEEVGISFTEPEETHGVHLAPVEFEGGQPGSPEPINRNQISVNPASKELQLIDLSKRFLAAAHYWSLPAQFLGAKINSYGGTLEFSFSYNNSFNFLARPTNNSDVILQGNGETLVYHDPGAHPEPEIKHTAAVKLDEAGWKTEDGKPATREDMMNVLTNISNILIRTVYDSSMLSTGIGNVSMQVAGKSETTSGDVNPILIATSVENCECPEGYTGLSCQECDLGYERHRTGPYIGKCVRLPSDSSSPAVRICDEGYTGENCDQCAEGYTPYLDRCTRYPDTYCSVAGSVGMNFGEQCQCKPGCQGPRCDQCKPGFYFLSEQNPDGCLSCFCMGVTDQCNSTKWNRTHIAPDYSPDSLFVITNAALSNTYYDVVSTEESRGDQRAQPHVVASLDQLPADVYYWMLPGEFLGNKLTSYGGNLDYTIRYSELGTADARPIARIANVRLSGSDINLDYVSEVHPSAGQDTRYVVPIKEEGWSRDGKPATRADMLMVLSDLKSFLIRATYSNQVTDVRITNIFLDTAVDHRTGQKRAYEVEQCQCPVGYGGLSCEECTAGYHRVEGGDYLGTCRRCHCSGHSDDCNMVTGVCQNCLHNTAGAHCEFCAAGYYGDARAGGADDCQLCPCPKVNGREVTCSVGSRGHVTCDRCPDGYEGDRCERCAEGYVGDPLSPGTGCRRLNLDCQCDPSGSVDNSCNQRGQCVCKESAEGAKCDRCKPGYFNLNLENDEGCLPCFCMGLTRECTSASFKRNTVASDFRDAFGGFALTNRQASVDVTAGLQVLDGGRTLSQPRLDTLPRSITYFWKLGDEYLGDKIVSYGGRLQYTVSYTTNDVSVSVSHPDVILMGNDIMLFSNIGGAVRPDTDTERMTVFREAYWRRPDGQPATREHLLMALADVEEILIRASYSTNTVRTSISDVQMETASESALMSEPAFEVEQCVCPDGYKGLSCEDCAPGYTRSGSGGYLGWCHQCQCNGRADTCDTETGVCIDCRENTAGDHCELCGPGYFGNPVQGGTCRPCSCPGLGANSFSPTCDFNAAENTLTCTACEEGYTGTRCENCDTGYEGNPSAPGGRCTRIVRPPVVVPGQRPKVTVDPKQVRVEPGSSFTLRCSVTSSQRVRVTWRRPGKSLPRNSVLSDNSRTLTISNVASADDGTYLCEATNRYGTATDSSEVSVARPDAMIMVEIHEPRRLSVQVGSDVSFVCEGISKNKMPFVSFWQREGGKALPRRAFDFGGILSIRDVQLEDSGSYVCLASNMYGIAQDSATLVVTEG